MKKKQHYLPRFYLRNFSDNDGRIWGFDRLEEKFFDCTDRDIGCEQYLYETHWEDANPKLGKFVLPNQIENKFAEREGEYSKVLKKIIDICSNLQNKKALICNKEEKSILASFVSNMLLRNPWSMREVDLDCVTDGIMDVEEIKTMDKALQIMNLGGMKSLVRHTSKVVWLDEDFDGSVQQRTQHNLFNTKYCIMIAKHEQFITSSFPVLCGINEMAENNNRVTCLPFHPQLAVFYCDSLPYNASNRMVFMSGDDIDFINKQYLILGNKQARFIYAKSRIELEKLILLK